MPFLDIQLAEEINNFVYEQVSRLNLTHKNENLITAFVLIGITLLIAGLGYYILNKVLRKTFSTFAKGTKSKFDDILLYNKIDNIVAKFLPLFLINWMYPSIIVHVPKWKGFLSDTIDVAYVMLITVLIRRLIYATKDYLRLKPAFQDKPLISYVQFMSFFLYFIAAVIIFSIVTGKSVTVFLTTIGAASAIILLIFKDSILGFVASIQITTNDMVRIGDWIEMSKYGADGDVIDISINTVKVRNFDKTITTIPTYALVSDSFRNYRGMRENQGRRIKRSVFLKLTSVRFLTNEEIESLKKIQLVTDYLIERKGLIDHYNKKIGADKSVLINGRNITNVGLFRQYVLNYLHHHPKIRKDQSLMVRQMDITHLGMPLEVYCFTNTTEWAIYEGIAADVFDHILSAAPYFMLEIYQAPSGGDLHKMGWNSLEN